MEEQTVVESRRLSQSEKQNHVTRYLESGLSQTDYCRREGLAIKNFHNWLKKARSAGINGVDTKFVELKNLVIAPSAGISASSLELKLPNGAELRFSW